MKAVLVSFVGMTRIIIAGDEPTNGELQLAFKQAMVNLTDGGIENLEAVVEDAAIPYDADTDKPMVVYQPEFLPDGYIKGHAKNSIPSFIVWVSKEKLMKDYPNCTPLEYNEGDIEEPTIV